MNARFRCNYRHLPQPPVKQPTPEPSFSQHLVAQFCTLDNDIHPIFSKANFPGADYELLKPSLQLASLLIDTDCLLDFWHAIFFGDNRRVDEDDTGERWHWAYFRPRLNLSARDRAKTRLRLRTLGQTFKFHRDAQLQSLGGMCDCTDRLALSHTFERGDLRGVVESVRYSEATYQALRSKYAWAEHCCDLAAIERIQNAHLSFAVLLVHEVAHAAVAATVGISEAAIFENNTMSEDGYDLEAHLFGGVITDVGRRGLVFKEWPSPSIGRFYRKEGCWIWMQEESSLDAFEALWNVPQAFVDRLFSETFWRCDVPKRGAAALRVPKTTGYRGTVDESGTWTVVRPDERGAESLDGVPWGWWADREYLYLLENDAEIEEEGFGRLMRINLEGLWDDEERQH